MKKGFTLVELLAVIVVLGILATIVGVSVSGVLDVTKEKSYEQQVNVIVRAAKEWGVEHTELLPETGSYCVMFSSLINSGKLDSIPINPITNKAMTGGVAITFDANKQQYLYSYQANVANEACDMPDPGNSGTTIVNAPNLLNDSLTPVVWDGTNWRVADTSAGWYNYDNQQWANAVILKSGVTKNVNDIVVVPTEKSTTSEVQAMYVWIPRYEYKIEGQYGTHTDGTAGTQATPGEIMVNFVSQMQTAASTGYILHPAFWWDNNSNGIREAGEELSGMWVGKFLTSGTETAPTVLPNVEPKSLGFEPSLLIKNYLTTTINTDSHAMKNSEYGSVAYLTQSKYGKYGNASYVGADKELDQVALEYTTKITGRSTGSPIQDIFTYYNLENTYEYSEVGGYGASSTGTIYGVYDLNNYSGTAVMAYYDWDPTTWPNSSTGYPDTSFTEKPASKYFDNYISGDFATACNGVPCLGHALTETAGWYGDSIGTLDTTGPWLLRGTNGLFNTSSYPAFKFVSSYHSVLISIGG